MIRKLAFVALGLAILVAALQLIMSLSAMKAGEHIKSEVIDKTALDYRSFSVELLSGEVHYKQVSLHLFALKRSVSAERLIIDFGNSWNLITGLPALYFNDLSSIESVRLESGHTELFDALFYDWLDDTDLLQPALWTSVLSCSGTEAVTEQSFKAMAIEDLQFDLELELGNFKANEPLSWKLKANIDKLARVQADWKLDLKEKAASEISKLNLSIVELGLFRRIYDTCNAEVTREDFAAQNVAAWQTLLNEQHIRFSSGLRGLVQAYMREGGELGLALTRKAASAPIVEGTARELTEAWSIAGSLNKQPGTSLQAFYEPPVVVVPNESPIIDPLAEPQSQVAPLYQDIEKDDVDSMLGQHLKLTLKNSKEFEGRVSKTDPYYIELVPQDGDGKVAFSLERVEIEKIEELR